MIEIHRSALKHGVAAADIRHAVVHRLIAVEIGDDPPRVLSLGPSRAAGLLEIVSIVRDNAPDLAIHAMPMRPRYHELLRRPR